MIEKIQINDDDRILIVAPHPDDECIGVGGILSQYPEKCTVVVCTDGRRSCGNENPLKIVKTRTEEFQKEMEFLHITNYQQLYIEDGTLMQHEDCLDEIDISVYTKIFFPHNLDGHPDHTATYMSVLKQARNGNIVAELYMYEVHKQLQTVSHYLDITYDIDKKLKLISFHTSQLENTKYDEMILYSSQFRALQLSLPEKYVECYTKIEIAELFEVNNVELKRTEENYQKQLMFYYVLVNWMRNVQNGFYIGQYLKKQEISKVAIYGYAELGKLLEKELQTSGIEVAYIMDKGKKNCEDKTIYIPQLNLPNVDAVIITAIFYYDSIKKELENYGYERIYSLAKIVDEMLNKE
jgi:LmbE family N-acetylglucosaminyl deacetylase